LNAKGGILRDTAPSSADQRQHLDLRLLQATGTRDRLERDLVLLIAVAVLVYVRRGGCELFGQGRPPGPPWCFRVAENE
jgi:hypothetical protein